MRRAALLFLLGACSAPASSPAPPPVDKTFGGARPLEMLRVPGSYDPSKPAPLVLLLHGYGVSGTLQAIYFNLATLAEEQGFILAAPDGTLDAKGRRFWNALDFWETGVDDVKYLLGLIDELAASYAIDRKRVYLIGHSNGSAMSYRLACDAADRFAAVVSLGGTFYLDPGKCRPTSPVAIREMHGTADEVLPYEGGKVSLPTGGADVTIPSALAIAEAWAKYNACANKGVAPAVDADADAPGAETSVTRWSGCAQNGDVELWTMQRTIHVPFNLSRDFGRMMWAFLDAHPKR